ncbi:MAG: DUF4138 domain-containing protein [Sphingobacteriaceae bacterium]|nr:DUF4138 domain-containing protein [Sphingobacteriaceae bacterium]
MKTFKIVSILSLLILQLTVFAQDTIFISYNKVTALQFPSPIGSSVVSAKNVLASIKDENVLTLKAIGSNFNTSNIEINTIDGKSYKMPVSFSYGRSGKFIRIKSSEVKKPPVANLPLTNVEISRRIGNSNKGEIVSTDKSSKVKGSLGSISISGNNIFYKLKVKNRSNIGFDIDFIRFYVRDLKTAKRTVTQEAEIYPVSSYGTDLKCIEGRSAGVYVFALNKFPVSKDKALFVEIYEKNGARHLSLKASKSDIENARPLK